MKRSGIKRRIRVKKYAPPRPGLTPSLPRNWKALCREVIARDKICRLCGIPPSTVGFDVNHIIPRRVADPVWVNDLANLALLCDPCHSGVTHYHEPRLYQGNVLAWNELLRKLGFTGPVPTHEMLAFAYAKILEVRFS